MHPFLGIHDFSNDQMSWLTKLIDDVITTKHITRPLGNLKALPQLLSLINEVPSSETVPSSFIPLKNIK